LGARALNSFSIPEESGSFLPQFAVVLVTAAAVLLHLSTRRWYAQSRSPHGQRGVAAALLWHLLLTAVAGWQFHRLVQLPADHIEVADANVRLEQVRNVALVTDRGREVPVFQVKSWDAKASSSNSSPVAPGDALARHASPDTNSNCFGWIFTGGRYWLNDTAVETILEDNGYATVQTPAAGDLIVYRGDRNEIIHTGLVLGVFDDGLVLIESKWGIGGRFIHQPENQVFSGSYTYYHSRRLGAEGLASQHQVAAAESVKIHGRSP
jgi:hypothetical protein